LRSSYIRFCFATVTHSPFGAQDQVARERIGSIYSGGEDEFWARPNPCFKRERIVRGRMARVNWTEVCMVLEKCKSFLERKIHKTKKVQRKEGRSMLRHYKGTKKPPLL
jgi:hypothetical protein